MITPYKNCERFKEKSNKICYIPEAEDCAYTYWDILAASNNDEELTERVWNLLDWQHVEILVDELEQLDNENL